MTFVIQLAGLALVAVAAFLISVPLGLFVLGLCFLVVGVAMDLR